MTLEPTMSLFFIRGLSCLFKEAELSEKFRNRIRPFVKLGDNFLDNTVSTERLWDNLLDALSLGVNNIVVARDSMKNLEIILIIILAHSSLNT